jgi:hypothetical protein
MLEVAGVSVPAGLKLDGEALGDVLLGRSMESHAAPIFWRRPPDRKTVSPALPERLPDLAMREGDWKLLCEYDGSLPQLYDLAKDHGETTNLAEQHPEVVRQMSGKLLAWHESMPPDNGPALGIEIPKGKGKRKKAK